MTRALVMGGTSFFGKRLVEYLLEQGCQVTVATRGTHPDPFGERISRVFMDRQDLGSMQKALTDIKFDIVFDQIGYAPDDMADACSIFAGKIGRYVFTSSSAVYSGGESISEADFDPMSIEAGTGRKPPLDYDVGKRRAEAYLFQKAPFPVAAARLPIVMGVDDTSDRLQKHVRCVLTAEPIVVPLPCGRWNHIFVEDAGRFVGWLGLTGRTGPYNGASRYALSTVQLILRIGDIVAREPIILDSGDGWLSSYASEVDKIIDVSKAENDGFEFTSFEDWFAPTVREIALNVGQ